MPESVLAGAAVTRSRGRNCTAPHTHPEPQPGPFLTPGSPLALPRAVFDRLTPAPRPDGPAPRGARIPGGTRRVNIADPDDPVAVPPHLAGFFDGISLDRTTTVSSLYRFHHTTSCLQSPTTAATVAPYLGIRVGGQVHCA